ncbi:hypothetical protein [Aminobacter sp. Piv2-1]|uniref:hypothetical protein n=1 Tax=Aminobacter sp. Piv2-1 TaxID=3031122 RepID=UPI0030B016D1
MKSPNSKLVATVAQDPFAMAKKAVDVGYDMFQGGKAPAQPVVIPVHTVTRANADQFKGWSE